MTPQDLHSQVPDIKLLPGEKITAIENPAVRAKKNHASSLQELYKLAQTTTYGHIGDHGPVLASLALDDTQLNPHFHRYEAVYGRDSLRVALDLLHSYPELAHVTLQTLAGLQGVTTNSKNEEEPGRIVHEARNPKIDPVARELTKNRGWGWPYYGSVDATLEYIRTFIAYCKDTKHGIHLLDETYIGRDDQQHTMLDSLQAAVKWTTRRLDANPEGLLEYQASLPGGLENQAWKDSWDSYSHADGSIANHHKGIASVEVQCIAYDALLDVASLYEDQLAMPRKAAALRKRADNLKQQIMHRFWTNDRGGFFILGTDRTNAGKLRPLAIKTSNMGHLLHSRLLESDHAEIVRRREKLVRQLFAPSLLAASGIRTLANDEVRFRPGSYHNGSVWLWDTYLISRGLEMHGYYHLARELQKRILDVIKISGEFPEFANGDDAPKPHLNSRIVDIWDEYNNCTNRIEQPPQEVQAWTVAAVILIQENAHKKTPPILGSFEKEMLDSLKVL
jgi:glycogen debranching enzyme